MPSRSNNLVKVLGLFAILGLVVWGLIKAIKIQIRQSDDAVTAISDLRDPSPFRAALVGHLDKIHLSAMGFVKTRDPGLLQQAADSQEDFEKSVPEFTRQNPKLLPRAAGQEILQDYTVWKDSVGHLLAVSRQRTDFWNTWVKNFERTLVLIEQRLRPLIKTGQPQAEERFDAVLKVENQARSWQQSMVRLWDDPNALNKEIAAEAENRGEIFLDSAIPLAILKAEKQNLREMQGLWKENSDLTRKVIAFGTVQSQAMEQAHQLRDRTKATLNKLLPAMRPEDLEAKKSVLLRAMRWHLIFAGLLALLGILLTSFTALAVKRMLHGSSPLIPKPSKKSKENPPTLVINADGTITEWSSDAEKLYGYDARETLGQSIGKLFPTESDIEQLYNQLRQKKTEFTTTHRNKAGGKVLVRIVFRSLTTTEGKSTAIALDIHRA